MLSTCALSLGGCDAGIFTCDHELKSSVASPDGRLKAGVVFVQCGATTADATWVVLGASHKDFDYERDQVAVFEGGDVALGWAGNRLFVMPRKARAFRTDAVSKGVRIEYRSRL